MSIKKFLVSVALFFITSCMAFANTDKAELVTEEIFGKKYTYYLKQEMYQDRIALIQKNATVVIISPEDGTVASIASSHTRDFKIKNVNIKRDKAEFEIEIIKKYWEGDGEFKEVSKSVDHVGDMNITYQLKKNNVYFEADTLCKTRYSMHPYWIATTPEIKNEEEDYRVFLKAHYKKSITEMKPYEGKTFHIMLDDDNSKFSTKARAANAAGGYKEATVYYRHGYKSLELKPINSKSKIGLYVVSHFLGAKGQRFHVSSHTGGGYESMKYQTNGFARSTPLLKPSNKIHNCGGLLTLK